MSVNTKPIFTGNPRVSWFNYGGTDATKTVVNNSNNDFVSNGALTTSSAYRIFIADSTYGSYVQKIRFRPLGANVSTVGRVWIAKNSNIVTSGLVTDSILYDEISLPSTSAVAASTAYPNYELPLNFALPPGYCVYVTLGTTVASGFAVCVVGGDYLQ